MNKQGKLILIPTPIDDETGLEPVALALLNDAWNNKENSVFAVEEIKEGRRRWLRFGLPRETIERFVLYNEHTRNDESKNLINKIQQGKTVYLMSDCGLPAFCDPGRELVALCHQHEIKVTATPFPNSIALAVALSGFNHDKFVFEGFVPREKDERTNALKNILKERRMSIIMDTPYRLAKILAEFARLKTNRKFFLGTNLNKSSEELLIGNAAKLAKLMKKQKREFILITEPLNS